MEVAVMVDGDGEIDGGQKKGAAETEHRVYPGRWTGKTRRDGVGNVKMAFHKVR